MATKIKVKRRKLPFKSLDELEKEARVQMRRAVELVKAVIERDIREAAPDPDEGAIEGSMLKKSLHAERVDEAYEQALRDYNRRELHGAPNDLNQLSQDTVKEIISQISWVSGALVTDPTILRQAEMSDEPEEVNVPVHAITYPGFNTAELNTALNGTFKVPSLLAVKGTRTFWAMTQGASCFAAAVMRLPAVSAKVYWVDEVLPLPSSIEPYQDMKEAETLASLIVRGEVYDLPSRFEPIAEQARAFSQEVLKQIVSGETSQEEREARERAVLKDRERMDLWMRLYNEASVTASNSDQANRMVRDDARWKRAEDIAEKSFELAGMIEERWDGQRQALREALKTSLQYMTEDGEEVKFLPLYDIYTAISKGRPQKEDTALSTGTLNGVYELDDEVEVCDSQGKWSKGKVKRVDNGIVKVLRDDGQYRAVTDPTAIRREGAGKIGLDNDDGTEYNKDMEEIRLDRFDVIIPAGSNSAKIEHALINCTAWMNQTPLLVNKETWARNFEAQQKETDRLVARCHELAGEEFRPHAPGDCSRILFEVMELPTQRVGKGGKPSTDSDTLQALDAMGHPIAGAIMEARSSNSILSQLREWEPYAIAGKVQCNWDQFGQPHGRYTSDSPNLQNRVVPVRETIEAPPGYKLLSNDLGQAEYVTWASLSNDPVLSASFTDGTDFHLKMYDEVKAAAPEVDLHNPDNRQAGKKINFALLYLMQPFILGKQLGIPTAEADKIIQAYKARASLADQYRENVLSAAQKSGQVSTHFGRTRYMPLLKKARGPALHEQRKTAWHHHNAGTAAEILKLKQANVFRAIPHYWNTEQVKIVIQLHDELILVVKDELLDEVRSFLMEKFLAPIKGFLPFRVTEKVGQNWLNVSK